MTDNVLIRIRERLRAILKTSKFEYTTPRFDTSDILQESIIQVAKEIDDKQDTEPNVSNAWLKTVAFGHLANLRRFNHAAKRSVKRENGKNSAAETTMIEFDPLEVSSKKEQVAIALEALAELTPVQRQIVHLRFFEQATYEQIAERVNVTVHNVRVHLTNSLRRIRAKVAPDHESTS